MNVAVVQEVGDQVNWETNIG